MGLDGVQGLIYINSRMSEQPEYIALINPVPGIPEAEQRKMLAGFEVAESFVVGKDGTLDQFLSLVRPPRVVLVAYAALLAEQRGDKWSRRDKMVATKETIHDRRHGSYVVQADGQRSDKDWRKMAPAGERMCGRLAKGQKSALNGKRGAKPWSPEPEKKRMAREIFRDKRHPTIAAAVAAVKAALGDDAAGRTVLLREFGSPYGKR